jgi:hypothetical protein
MAKEGALSEVLFDLRGMTEVRKPGADFREHAIAEVGCASRCGRLSLFYRGGLVSDPGTSGRLPPGRPAG